MPNHFFIYPKMHRRQRLLVAVIATAAIAAGCGRPVPPSSAIVQDLPNYCASATSPPYPDVLAPNGKKFIVGLLDLGQTNFPSASTPANTLYYACNVSPAINGLVVNDNWADLQPGGENTPIMTRNIDAALAAVAAYNASNPAHPVGVRLRVMGGIDAPGWAKDIGGPIPICDASGSTPPPTPFPTPPGATPTPSPTGPTPCPAEFVRTAGAYWTEPYQQAWSNVQHQLAAKYDGNPLIAEVSVTSCVSFGDEEFLSPIDEWTTDNLNQFGYTNEAFEACLMQALDAYSGWRRTIIDDIFNPFYMITFHSPILTWDVGFTEALMQNCVSSLGSRCLLDNQELGKFTPAPSGGPTAPPNVQNLFAMWSYMESLHEQGVMVTFQTTSPGNLLHTWGSNDAGWNAVVQLARQFGAGSLELWPPELSTLPSPAPGGTPIPCLFVGHPEFTGYTCFSTPTLLGWGQSLAPNGP